MPSITLVYGLPFVPVVLRANGQAILLERVLFDTGSVATIFNTDALASIGILPQLEKRIRYMTGVGGLEPVLESQIEAIEVGELIARQFRIQMGAMNYGIPMDGILGMDFLLQTGAMIDLQRLEVTR